VVLLTRLGVDVGEQGKGLGSALVRDALLQTAAIADRVGVRALLIHAETPEAADFYRGIDSGFEPSPTNPLHLLLLMKDLRAAIRAAIDATDAGASRP
jgi:GNAT superfamily N-acetyltransferase